jgi:N-acetylated-alpha-linked acidic dipeptidase
MLRLADAAVLPFEFAHFARVVTGYLDEIQKEAEGSSRHLDFSPLRRDLEALTENASKYDALLEAMEANGGADPDRLRDLNALLIRSERVLTRSEGLPNRPWYKHQIYAPGFYTGYEVKTLPGIREAVEEKNWTLAQHETAVVGECLSDLNTVVDRAVSALSGL